MGENIDLFEDEDWGPTTVRDGERHEVMVEIDTADQEGSGSNSVPKLDSTTPGTSFQDLEGTAKKNAQGRKAPRWKQNDNRSQAPPLLPISVRFTAKEKAWVERNAAQAGLSISRFLARAGASGMQPLTAEERDLYIKIVVHLNHVGNNINQLAAAMNAGRRGTGTAPELSEVEKAGRAIQELVSDIRKKIKV